MNVSKTNSGHIQQRNTDCCKSSSEYMAYAPELEAYSAKTNVGRGGESCVPRRKDYLGGREDVNELVQLQRD